MSNPIGPYSSGVVLANQPAPEPPKTFLGESNPDTRGYSWYPSLPTQTLPPPPMPSVGKNEKVAKIIFPTVEKTSLLNTASKQMRYYETLKAIRERNV